MNDSELDRELSDTANRQDLRAALAALGLALVLSVVCYVVGSLLPSIPQGI